jgi:methyl-accepting chemotaxis protein
MAYVLVQDRTGAVFAHSFPVLPGEMQTLPATLPRDGIRRMVEIGKNTVIEMSVPVLDGRLGAVRVGVWQNEIDAVIAANIAPLLKWIALIAISGTFVAVYLVWKINQPIVTLVRAAREISHGELDAPGGCRVDDSSEYGELSRAFERMRASVKAAMIRLGSEL